MGTENKVVITIEADDKSSGAFQKVKTSLGEIGEGGRGVSSMLGKMTANWAILATGVNQGLEIFKKATGAFADIMEAGEKAAKIQRLETSFEAIAKAAGYSSDAVLKSMKAATGGMLDESDQMGRLSRLMQENIDPKFIVSSMQMMRKQAPLMGESMKEAFDKYADAVTTGRVKGIQLYTGVLDLDSAYKNFAASIGTSVERLSEKTKVMIRAEEIEKKLQETTQYSGEVVSTAADRMDAYKASVNDAWEQIGKESIPIAEKLWSIYSKTMDIIAGKKIGGLQITEGNDPYTALVNAQLAYTAQLPQTAEATKNATESMTKDYSKFTIDTIKIEGQKADLLKPLTEDQKKQIEKFYADTILIAADKTEKEKALEIDKFRKLAAGNSEYLAMVSEAEKNIATKTGWEKLDIVKKNLQGRKTEIDSFLRAEGDAEAEATRNSIDLDNKKNDVLMAQGQAYLLNNVSIADMMKERWGIDFSKIDESGQAAFDALSGYDQEYLAIGTATTKEIVQKWEESYDKNLAMSKDFYDEQASLGKEFTKDEYDFRIRMINLQAAAMAEAGMSEAQINEKKRRDTAALYQEMALRSNDFFAGLKAGYERDYGEFASGQKNSARLGLDVWGDFENRRRGFTSQTVDAFIQGESLKGSIMQAAGDQMAGLAGDIAKRMYDKAIDKIINMIGAYIGEGAAATGAEGAAYGGVTGALTEIGIYLGTGVASMLAGRAMAQSFKAEGGWVASHPTGGWISGGSGIRDDVFLGNTPGVRHWGMGGEFVINKDSAASFAPLLEAINKTHADGGLLPGGPVAPWEGIADKLAMGTGFSFLHGFWKGGGPYTGIAEAIAFVATAIPTMFGGKLLGQSFKADGGWVGGEDRGHGWGGFLGAIFSPLQGAFGVPLGWINDLKNSIPGLNYLPDPVLAKLNQFKKIMNPEDGAAYIRELMREPFRSVATDLVTPGVYAPGSVEGAKAMLTSLRTLYEQEMGAVPFFHEGVDFVPKTGPAILEYGERVVSREENTRTVREDRPIVINLDLTLDGEKIVKKIRIVSDELVVARNRSGINPATRVYQ